MIFVDYSKETLNLMSKEELIEYIELMKIALEHERERVNNNSKFIEAVLTQKDKLNEEYEKVKNSYMRDVRLFEKELEILKGVK